jgi:Ca2+-binding RTX toxin-like protein
MVTLPALDGVRSVLRALRRSLARHPQRRSRRPSFETLEHRTTPTASAVFTPSAAGAATGKMVITIDNADSVVFGTSPDGNFVLNGSVVATPATTNVKSANVQEIAITATGAFSNLIDLSGLVPHAFTGLTVLSVSAGDGDDAIVASPKSGPTGAFDGGGGIDTLDYSAFTTSVIVDLSRGTATNTGGVLNLENVNGGAADDVLQGDNLANVLTGQKGKDTLVGGAGNDLLFGGNGGDALNGGSGNDLLEGGAGGDSLSGGAGNDHLKGGDGGDTLSGGAGNDRLQGGAGGDSLNGGAGTDDLTGGPGDDSLDGGPGNDILRGTRRDRLRGGPGRDRFIGAKGQQ